MRIEQDAHNIILLLGDTQYEVASTFMRLQEFYESPNPDFRGHYFGFESYMDWYAKEYGNFTYTKDWSGFNVPGDVVRKFFFMFNDMENLKHLFRKEEHLESLLADYMSSSERFYVIATSTERFREDPSVVEHEYAHGLFHIFDEYQKEMSRLVKKLPKEFRAAVRKFLLDMGYCKEVIVDETQAYVGTSSMPYLRDKFGKKLPWDEIADIQCYFDEFKTELDL